MSLTTTTTTAIINQQDTFITVSSATNFTAGYLVKVNGEWMQIAQNYVSGTNIPVLRGRDGSPQTAHAKTSNVTVGIASDAGWQTGNWPAGVPDAVTSPVQPAFPIKAYQVAGAIDVRQHIAIINGTSVLAMTLANPSKDMDGQIVFVVSNGNAAHTLDLPDATGVSGAGSSYDTITYPANAQACLMFMACNAAWCLVNPFMSGTLTNIEPGLA